MNIKIEIGNNLKEAICKIGNTEQPGIDVREAFGLNICSLLNSLLLSKGEKALVGRDLIIEIKDKS